MLLHDARARRARRRRRRSRAAGGSGSIALGPRAIAEAAALVERAFARGARPVCDAGGDRGAFTPRRRAPARPTGRRSSRSTTSCSRVDPSPVVELNRAVGDRDARWTGRGARGDRCGPARRRARRVPSRPRRTRRHAAKAGPRRRARASYHARSPSRGSLQSAAFSRRGSNGCPPTAQRSRRESARRAMLRDALTQPPLPFGQAPLLDAHVADFPFGARQQIEPLHRAHSAQWAAHFSPTQGTVPQQASRRAAARPGRHAKGGRTPPRS